MKTIQTKPDCTLAFCKIPVPGGKISYSVKDCDSEISNVVFKSYSRGEVTIPYKLGKSHIIGCLSEITEDQAKELLESLIVNGFCCYKDYIDSANAYFGASVLMSLKSAALSVGIEEKDFDKYLVVKL